MTKQQIPLLSSQFCRPWKTVVPTHNRSLQRQWDIRKDI